MENVLDAVFAWGIPIVATAVILWLVVVAVRFLFGNKPGNRIKRQMAQFAACLLAVVLLVLILPVNDQTQGQLLSLLGLVLTGVIGLASTSFVSNAMAGFMLRSVANFHGGDFVRVGEYFGRVTETALFHTEIQNEERDLVTLPNLYLITHPVEVVRSNGTLISADVSLGFDVNRRRIRDLLIQAAQDAELTDAFVQVTKLGDYSVNYRVSAMLHDVTNLVTKRSALRANMLDRLHEASIEIVSPSFMNQRPIGDAPPFIPARHRAPDDDDDDNSHADRLMFDKAQIAGRIKRLQDQRDKLTEDIASLSAEPGTQDFELAWRKRQLESLEEILASLSAEPADRD